MAGAVQGAGVDAAEESVGFVVGDMGVAGEEVPQVGGVFEFGQRAENIAVGDADLPAPEVDYSVGAQAGHAEIGGVSGEAVAVPVVVAKDEVGGDFADEAIDDVLAGEVAAVDEGFGAVAEEQGNGCPGFGEAVV